MKLEIFSLLAASAGWSLAAPAAPEPPRFRTVAEWHEALGPPSAGESFGAFVTRAAALQHGAPYEVTAPPPGHETIRIELESFECVSFIESAIALARCGWNADPSEACFLRELELTRYRKGEMGDYASRLHYFVDWIADNEARGRLEPITAALGGKPVQRDFFHISRRVLPRAELDAAERARLIEEIASTEDRLSRAEHAVLGRERAPDALQALEEGDIVAFTRERSGLLVHHAGFVHWVGGTPRLLHASSYHQRVVITIEDVTNYLLRRPERRGVIATRPLAPAPAAAGSAGVR